MKISAIESAFERTLSAEIVGSELLRVRVLAATLGALLVADELLFLFRRDLVEQFTQKPLPAWLPARAIGPFLAYEIVALLFLDYRFARGSTFPTAARFANALIETSLPTVILWWVNKFTTPAIAFGTWPTMLYFIFIVASTLRLDFAQRALAEKVRVAPGYGLEWSGQFEYLERAKAKLAIVVPITLLIIFVLLYLNFGRLTETLIVMLSVPFALVGGVWLMDFMHFNMSVAVAVGFIALAGVAAETGVVMLIYLDHALTDRRNACARDGRAFTRDDLRAAIMAGAVERVRPKMMTVTAIIAGLLPILWSHGTGSELMQRIAVPMIGGMVSSTVLTLIVIPAVYGLVKGWGLERARQQMPAPIGRPAE